MEQQAPIVGIGATDAHRCSVVRYRARHGVDIPLNTINAFGDRKGAPSMHIYLLTYVVKLSEAGFQILSTTRHMTKISCTLRCIMGGHAYCGRALLRGRMQFSRGPAR